jgi:hypothetical protein
VATRQRPSSNQKLARQVQDILVGCGLSQSGSSIVGGTNHYLPTVIKVVSGPSSVELIVRILPGQMPDHYAAHAQTIAYNLDMAEVRVVGVGPYLIRLELVPKSPSSPAPETP